MSDTRGTGPLRQALHEGWTLRAVTGPQVPPETEGRIVPATVPGCVHTDLLAAGLIPDPYLDDNETRLAWIGHTDWVYETTFDRPPAPTGGSTWSVPGWTRWPRWPSTGSRWAGRRTCTAATAST